MINEITVNGLLTEPQAAKFLGVCQRTLFSLRSSGKIAHVKIGRLVRYELAELGRFIRESVVSKIKQARQPGTSTGLQSSQQKPEQSN